MLLQRIQANTGYFRLLQADTGCYKILKVPTGFFRLLQVTTGFRHILNSIILFYFGMSAILGYCGHNHSYGQAPNWNASPFIQYSNMMILSILIWLKMVLNKDNIKSKKKCVLIYVFFGYFAKLNFSARKYLLPEFFLR